MTTDDTPARLLRSALEPIAAVSFHSEPVIDSLAAVGLADFGPRYTWSRSSVLGPADPAVVVAAFGVWEPDFIADNLRRGRQTCSLDDVRNATDEGARAAVHSVLADVDAETVRHVTRTLWHGVDHCDTTGRTLFAGNRALERPDDPYLGLWRVATAWRELRGDSNLAACIARGLSGLQANVLNELHSGYPLGEYTATRNWSDDQIRAAAEALRARGLLDGNDLSAAGQALRDSIEDDTDTAVDPAMNAIANQLGPTIDLANEWSQAIVERGWFPDDAQKRAAG